MPGVVNSGAASYLDHVNFTGSETQYPERVPASPELAARATELAREFSECFWFWYPDATVRFTDDVKLVIEHLREYGDKQAWAAAGELQRLL